MKIACPKCRKPLHPRPHLVEPKTFLVCPSCCLVWCVPKPFKPEETPLAQFSILDSVTVNRALDGMSMNL